MGLEQLTHLTPNHKRRTSKLTLKPKSIILFASLTAILFCAWADPLDKLAANQVDAGFKRAAASFATARLIGAVISVAQGTDVIMQPVGVGVKLAPGQLLHPLSDLVSKFADLMLTATVIFGAMKILLVIGGNAVFSAAVTVVTLWWFWFFWRGRSSPLWLSRLAVIVLLIRFSVPVTMVGSDAVYQVFMADKYKASQSSLGITAGDMESKPLDQVSTNTDSGWWERMKQWVTTNIDVSARIKAMSQSANQIVDHIINVIVVFYFKRSLFRWHSFGAYIE